VEMWEDIHQRVIRPHIQWSDPDAVPLRIGICGAHGTGKNKLAKRLGRELDLPVISHVPRTVKNLGLQLNRQADMNTQIAIWLAQINEQIDLFEFVADRTIIETVAYATLMVKDSEDKIDAYIVNAMANMTMALFNSQYTVVFYLPPTNEPIRNNGYRNRDLYYQAEIDKQILYYLSCFNVDYFPLQGNESKRYKLAMEYMADSGLLNLEQ
jgi:deoxyadenosine/deoxycytidine kinase